MCLKCVAHWKRQINVFVIRVLLWLLLIPRDGNKHHAPWEPHSFGAEGAKECMELLVFHTFQFFLCFTLFSFLQKKILVSECPRCVCGGDNLESSLVQDWEWWVNVDELVLLGLCELDAGETVILGPFVTTLWLSYCKKRLRDVCVWSCKNQGLIQLCKRRGKADVQRCWALEQTWGFMEHREPLFRVGVIIILWQPGHCLLVCLWSCFYLPFQTKIAFQGDHVSSVPRHNAGYRDGT